VRLLSGSFGRSDLAAELYDDRLFHGATFVEINDHPGPVIAIQATDVIEGTRFGFANYWFAPICSDLSRFPVSRAVAASSAVPLIFSPLVLQNYAGTCSYVQPTWAGKALAEGPVAGRAYQNARHLHAYQDVVANPRIYLVDGAVADNLVLHRVVYAVTNRGGFKALLRDLDMERVRRIAMIIVNAQTPPAGRWGAVHGAPGVMTLLQAAAGVQLNRYSFETIDLLRRSNAAWTRDYAADGHPSLSTYIIEVGFDQLADEAERRSFSGIPTTYDLPDAEIDRLRLVAQRILAESSDFQRLLRDLGATSEPSRSAPTPAASRPPA
jgi:NTE family protein